MSRGYQQGSADGLCGLYCILNFLSSLPGWDQKPDCSMEHILEAVDAEGILSPSWITEGYRSAELKGVVNRIFDRWWMDYNAIFLKEIKKKPGENLFELYSRILESGGSVIGGSARGKHWMLYIKVADKNCIVNSANPSEPVRPFDVSAKSYCSNDAIAIRPFTRQAVEIGS